MTQQIRSVGVIGLGAMGKGVAQSLLRAGFEVHVCDVRSPTRSWADRALPGDGIADVGRILRLLDDAGYDGLYDVEVFSDDGTFGTAHPDSLWAQPCEDVIERVRASFERTWAEARLTAAASGTTVRPRPPVSKEWQ